MDFPHNGIIANPFVNNFDLAFYMQKKFLENSKIIFKKIRLKLLGFLAGCLLIFGPRVIKFTDDIFRNTDKIKQVVIESAKQEDNLERALDIYDGYEKSRTIFEDNPNYPYFEVYTYLNNCYDNSKKVEKTVDSCLKEANQYFIEKIGHTFFLNHRIKTAFEERVWLEDFLYKASNIREQEEFDNFWTKNKHKIPNSLSDSLYLIIQEIRVNKIELDSTLKSTENEMKEIDSLFEVIKSKEIN